MSANQSVPWLLADMDPQDPWGSWEGKGALKLEGTSLRSNDFTSDFEE